jgi:hypothetical protein
MKGAAPLSLVKRFRLKSSVLGIEMVGGKQVAVKIPKRSMITVTEGISMPDSRMVEIQWNEKTLTIFCVDLDQRGEECTETGR